jgi:hypothetical protein
MRNFDGLSEREILARAISLEEDERIYADFAEGLRSIPKLQERQTAEELLERCYFLDSASPTMYCCQLNALLSERKEARTWP